MGPATISTHNHLEPTWNYRANRALSVYAYLFGPYDFNKSPMEPTGTRVIVHDKPGNRTSWGHHVTPVWYIGPSLDHYRCIQRYMPVTGIVRITDTLQYTPKAFAFQKTTTEDYLQQAIGDIISIIKNPSKTLTFLSYGDATKNAINHIAHILHRSTSQTRLQNLPLPPLLPQTHNENFQVQNIPSIPVTAPKVEPVS